MINYRIIARVFSQVLILEGLFMLLSAVISLLMDDEASGPLFYSSIITLVTGILVFTPLRKEEKVYGTREGYLITAGIWILLAAFGSLPFVLSGVTDNFTDAFFESISGYTTTGATIFDDVESLPRGILLWRSFTQWLGGVAFITLSLYVLPIVRTLNIQLPTTEYSGQPTDKIHPQILETFKRLIIIYVVLTAAETFMLLLGKMPLFDAVCHSLSTLSTGGFSTRNNNMAAFSSPYIKAVVALFMLFAGANLTLFYFAVKKNFKRIVTNDEFNFYILTILGFSLLISAVLFIKSEFPALKALQNGFFHVISIVTTTGFYTENYSNWGDLAIMLIFVLMFTGGMAGSASGGIKIIRLLIIARNTRAESRKSVHPYAFMPVYIDKKRVPQTIVFNLLVFVTLYFITLCIGTLIIALMNYDVITSFGTAASMLGNIGPAIGTFGPFTNYGDLPAAGKWFLTFLMLAGRLELLTVIVLLTRSKNF
ncbi:MAG: TrkH family potassium uptake protein [Bacteroidales bacterium]